LLNIKY